MDTKGTVYVLWEVDENGRPVREPIAICNDEETAKTLIKKTTDDILTNKYKLNAILNWGDYNQKSFKHSLI